MKFGALANKNAVRDFLIQANDTYVFWDAERLEGYDDLWSMLPRYAQRNRTFCLTNSGLGKYPHLYRNPAFRHQFLRRFNTSSVNAAEMLIRVAEATGGGGAGAVAFSQFFPAGTAIKKITLSHTSHHRAAIEAIQNALTKQGVRGRLAVSVAQATDELLLNALDHAPQSKEIAAKRKLFGAKGMPLLGREVLTVEIADTHQYMGICVADQFGTLKREALIGALIKRYEQDGLIEVKAGGRLGFHRIMEAGLSMAISVQAQTCTRAMVFFPKVGDYKEFRSSFRFFSLFL